MKWPLGHSTNSIRAVQQLFVWWYQRLALTHTLKVRCTVSVQDGETSGISNCLTADMLSVVNRTLIGNVTLPSFLSLVEPWCHSYTTTRHSTLDLHYRQLHRTANVTDQTNWHRQLASEMLQLTGRPNTRLPHNVPRQAQSVIHQLTLNRPSSMAVYQALIGQITSPVCPHFGTRKEMAEHLLLFCPKWAAECQRLDWHHKCVPGLWEPGGIRHLFGASARLPYRHWVMGLSRQQQQQQQHCRIICNITENKSQDANLFHHRAINHCSKLTEKFTWQLTNCNC